MMMEVAAETSPAYCRNLPVPIDGPIAIVPASPPERLVVPAACRLVGEITNELTIITGGYVQSGRDRRRRMAHVRQIAMYVCHVGLRIPMQDIGRAFGLDPTTVRYACHIVEDRRDDNAYDHFVSAIERMVVTVFSTWEEAEYA